MVYAVDETTGERAVGTGKAIGGVIGLFTILGLVIAVMGFAAAFSVAEDAAVTDVQTLASAVPLLIISLLPFLAAPVFSVGAGAWAGHATREGGRGAIAGAVGGLLGPILLLVVAALGIALGGAVAGPDITPAGVTAPTVGPTDIPGTLAYLASAAGITFLAANLVGGALAGALVGAIEPRGRVGEVEEVARRPAGA